MECERIQASFHSNLNGTVITPRDRRQQDGGRLLHGTCSPGGRRHTMCEFKHTTLCTQQGRAEPRRQPSPCGLIHTMGSAASSPTALCKEKLIPMEELNH